MFPSLYVCELFYPCRASLANHNSPTDKLVLNGLSKNPISPNLILTL